MNRRKTQKRMNWETYSHTYSCFINSLETNLKTLLRQTTKLCYCQLEDLLDAELILIKLLKVLEKLIFFDRTKLLKLMLQQEDWDFVRARHVV